MDGFVHSHRHKIRIEDKVVIITGSGGGIETALLFAKEGAKLVVADVNDECLQLFSIATIRFSGS